MCRNGKADYMKIKQISTNHVEVTVTEGDLLLFDMNMETLTPDSPHLRTFLFSVLEQVRSKTGMDVKSGQVIVEATRNENNIVFSIKRMGLTKREKREKYKNARAVIKPAVMKVHIYVFENFANMTDALCRIDDSVLRRAAIYSFQNEYYCCFKCDFKFDIYDAVLAEFCRDKIQFEATDAVLREYGKCIAEGDRVVSLINGIKKYRL